MAKFNSLIILAGIGVILLNAHIIKAKPFLSANFFVLTTRAPLNDQSSRSSSSNSSYQFGSILSSKLNLLRTFLQTGSRVKLGFKNFGLASSTTTTTTTTAAPDFDIDTVYEPQSTSEKTTSKTTTTTEAPASSETTTSNEKADNNEDILNTPINEIDLRSDLKIKTKINISLNNNNNNNKKENNNNDGITGYGNTETKSPNANNDISTNSGKTSTENVPTNNYGYTNPNKNTETNEIVQTSTKTNKYLPPEPQNIY